MKIVFNSSPLIFLSRLEFLDIFLDSADEFYLPNFVAEEISAKSDAASQQVKALIDADKILVKEIQLQRKGCGVWGVGFRVWGIEIKNCLL